MEEYQILKKKLEVPDDFMSILTRLISNEESRILVLIAEKFLTAFTIAEKLGENIFSTQDAVSKRLSL